MSQPIILLLSGPNLNLLGEREPEVYGTATLDDHVVASTAAASARGLALEHVQSNHEGELVDAIHAARGRCAAIVVNPGAFTHYAWAIHDALAIFDGPVVELHLSNPASREPWRHPSVVAPVADAADVLSAVAATGVAVGIISDTALATGRHLRTYLDAYGILQHVTFAAFSDEVGVYKPDPAIFAAALDGLGIGDPATAAHVGDLKRTDVAGARAMGMSTVRFRGVVDDPEDGAEADHVIDRLADLPRVLGPG